VRLSIGPATDAALVDEACLRIRACGEALRRHGPQNGPWCEEPGGLSGDVGDCRLVMGAQLPDFLRLHPDSLLVDVREPYEHALPLPPLFAMAELQAVPMSCLGTSAQAWLSEGRPLLFFCRSGNRSRQAAQALAGMGHEQSWTLAGGLALLPELEAAPDPALYV